MFTDQISLFLGGGYLIFLGCQFPIHQFGVVFEQILHFLNFFRQLAMDRTAIITGRFMGFFFLGFLGNRAEQHRDLLLIHYHIPLIQGAYPGILPITFSTIPVVAKHAIFDLALAGGDHAAFANFPHEPVGGVVLALPGDQ